MLIWALDDRTYDHCGVELWTAARKRGHNARLFRAAEEVTADGYAFMRLCQKQPRLDYDRAQYGKLLLSSHKLRFVQDRHQVDAYEDKLAQTALWRQFMPATFVFHSQREALTFAEMTTFPLVSKSAIGSASHNVRILRSFDEAVSEIKQAFGPGMKVSLGLQKDYWLVQHFVPHDTTYRVTIVGRKLHAYQRFNYKDRPVAAPSAVVRTKPLPMNAEVEDLLAFSMNFFTAAATKWCAIDVLKNPNGGWFLLETALGWARGNDESGNARFYGTTHSLLTQHELLLDEMEAGVFG